jgi:putative ABC transport system permease protein
MWSRSVTLKRPQAVLAIASILVGAAVASMLLNLYGDVRRKMTQEFRAYGPNVVIAPAVSVAQKDQTGAIAGAIAGVMDQSVTERLAQHLSPSNPSSAVPVLYAVARLKRNPPDPRLPEFQNLVAVGADFAALRRLYPAWRLQGSEPASGGSAVVIGSRVAALLHLGVGDSVDLESEGLASAQAETKTYRVAGVLSTGSSEDQQVFLPLASLQNLAGLQGRISLVELSLQGEAAEIEKTVSELSRNLEGVEVRPIRQIIYSSGKVLETIRGLTISLTGLILIIIALCVMATMTTIVLERRKDIAVMKALGASDRLVMDLFLSEGAVLGLIGAVSGYAIGIALARGMAGKLFNVALSPEWWTLPAVAFAGMVLAVTATLIPVKIVRRVRPATVLKGE